VLPSVTRLTEVLRHPFTRHIDRREIGRQESARWLDGVQRMIAADRQAGVRPPILHVGYSRLVHDPLGTLERLYGHFGVALAPAVADLVRAHTAEQPNGGYGINRYRVEDYGLDLQEERRKFAVYTDHFGIEPESAADGGAGGGRTRAPRRHSVSGVSAGSAASR
jgi:hypothetical protein